MSNRCLTADGKQYSTIINQRLMPDRSLLAVCWLLIGLRHHLFNALPQRQDFASNVARLNWSKAEVRATNCYAAHALIAVVDNHAHRHRPGESKIERLSA